MKHLPFKKSGFSLIEILVAIGVGVIIFGFIADLLVKQHKEQKLLSQKLELNDFKNNLISIFAKKNHCTCQFLNDASNPNLANYGSLTFNSTVTTGTELINTGAIYSACAGGANPPILLAANNQLLNGSQSLIVDTVKIINLVPSGGASNPNEWQGQWEIKLKVGTGSVDRIIKPITLTQKFIVDNPASPSARITACEGVSSGTGTVNYLTKWSAIPGVIEDSALFQDPGNGNIGIGTSTPGLLLDINGTGITSQIRAIRDNKAVYIDPNDNGGNINAQIASDKNMGLLFTVNYDSALNTQTNAMLIKATGDINIGISDTGAATSAEGLGPRLELGGVSTMNSDPLFLQRNNYALDKSELRISIGDNAGDAATAPGIDQFVIGGTDNTSGNVWVPLATFTTSGNTGIGTSAPATTLHVSQSFNPGATVLTIGSDNLDPNMQSVVELVTVNGLTKRLDHPLTKGWQLSGVGSSYSDVNVRNDFRVSYWDGTIMAPTAFRTDFLIDSITGNIGLGIINPTYQLQLSTDSAAKPGTSTWTVASDIRLKDIIKPYDKGINSILEINPIYFRYKTNNTLNLPANKEYIGIIAQEIQRVIPEAVQIDINGYLHVNNDPIIWSILNAVKEHYIQWQIEKKNTQSELIKFKNKLTTIEHENKLKDQKIEILLKLYEKQNSEIQKLKKAVY